MDKKGRRGVSFLSQSGSASVDKVEDERQRRE